MNKNAIDKGGLATVASLGGRHAEAGAILEGEAGEAMNPRDKNLALFLAATQFYLAGDFRKALRLAESVDDTLLDDSVSGLLGKFVKDCRSLL